MKLKLTIDIVEDDIESGLYRNYYLDEDNLESAEWTEEVNDMIEVIRDNKEI